MKIITVPNPVLRQQSQPVTKVDQKLVNFIKDLENTLINKKNPEGVGLSAPQVNQTLRVFSTWLMVNNQRIIKSYINPVIVKPSTELTLGPKARDPYLEGCLSIPKIYGPVWRFQSLTLEYQVINPKTQELEPVSEFFEDVPARVIQHEYDHLDGILFTDRTMESKLPLYEEDEHGDLIKLDVTQV